MVFLAARCPGIWALANPAGTMAVSCRETALACTRLAPFDGPVGDTVTGQDPTIAAVGIDTAEQATAV